MTVFRFVSGESFVIWQTSKACLSNSLKKWAKLPKYSTCERGEKQKTAEIFKRNWAWSLPI